MTDQPTPRRSADPEWDTEPDDLAAAIEANTAALNAHTDALRALASTLGQRAGKPARTWEERKRAARETLDNHYATHRSGTP